MAVTEAGKEVAAVSCSLTNKSGSWDVTAPGTAVVRRAPDELVITCQKGGSTARRVLKSTSKGEWCWNVFKCGGIGYVINDRSSSYEYPEKVTLELRN